MDVWRIPVGPPGDLALLLSPDEAERAAGFRFDRGRDAFVTARAALRTLIGSFGGIDPGEVVFGYGPNGKPEVEGLSFNVSHAGHWALAALAPEGRVGVDVETMRSDVEVRALSRRFFTSSENEALERLSGDDLLRGFYGCWTMKEAFVKATGEGLSFGLDRVETAVHPAPAGLVAIDGDSGAAAQWTAVAIDVAPGYAAAVVVDAPEVEVVVREWSASASV